jgi:hypothetical protein
VQHFRNVVESPLEPTAHCTTYRFPSLGAARVTGGGGRQGARGEGGMERVRGGVEGQCGDGRGGRK